jgi:hypothetical protein
MPAGSACQFISLTELSNDDLFHPTKTGSLDAFRLLPLPTEGK